MTMYKSTEISFTFDFQDLETFTKINGLYYGEIY